MTDAQSAVPEPDSTPDPTDARPVFQGAWNAATVAEREAHNAKVRAWKQAQGIALSQRTGAGEGDAQSRMATPSGQPASHKATPDAHSPTLDVLRAIRDDPNELASTRVRAAEVLIRAEQQQAEGVAHGGSDLVALREVLSQLAPSERLAWLQGERQGSQGGAA